MNVAILVFWLLAQTRSQDHREISTSGNEKVLERHSESNSTYIDKTFSVAKGNLTSGEKNRTRIMGHMPSRERRKILKNLLKSFHENREESPVVAEIVPEKLLIDHLSELYKDKYKVAELEENFDNGRKFAMTPIRRDVAESWHPSDDILDPNTYLENYDVYYSQDSKYNENDYNGYSSGVTEYPLRGNATIEVPREKTNPKNLSPQEGIYDEYDYSVDEQYKKRGAYSNRNYNRKYSKNACRLYLDFLKYAFEKLDEEADYRYAYVDDYEDYRMRQWKERLVPKEPIYSMRNNYQFVDHPEKEAQMSTKDFSILKNGTSSPGYQYPSSTPFSHPSTRPSPTTLTAYSLLPTREDHFSPIPLWMTRTELVTSTLGSSTRESTTEFYGTTPNPYTQNHFTSGFGNEYTQMSTQTTPYPQNKISETTMVPPVAVTKSGLPQWITPEDYNRRLANTLARTTTLYPDLDVTGIPLKDWINFRNSLGREEPSTVDYSDATTTDNPNCNDKMLPCPDTYNVTYPLNGYCNRYVTCENGRAVRRTCEKGLHFNVVTKSCDLPHNSFCNYGCPSPTGFYGIPGDCGGYFVCTDSVAEYRMCPPQMHWDTNRDACTFSELSACPMKCPQMNAILPYNGDCKAYVVCLAGTPYYHKCPPNSLFDDKLLTCVPSHLSKCKDNPKLLTRMLNINHLCKEFQAKLGTDIWCQFFSSNKNEDEYLEH